MAREIRFTSTWKLVVGFVLWTLVAGGFAYYSAVRLYEDYCFTHHAQPVTGKVVQKYYTVSHGRHGDTTTYHLSYNYRAGNMSGFCQQTIQRATYYYLSEGGAVPVMYLPENPAKVRVNLVIEEHAQHVETGILCAVAGIFVFGGAFLLVKTYLTNATCQRLQEQGIVTEGVVKNVGIDYVGKARTPKSYLQLEYRDSLGSTLEGRSLYLTSAQEMQWREGDRLEVRFDRNRPRTFMIDLAAGPRR